MHMGYETQAKAKKLTKKHKAKTFLKRILH